MAKCKKLLLSCLLGGAACIALGAGLILRGGTPVKADDNFAPAYTGEFNPQYFTYWGISDTGADNSNNRSLWRDMTAAELSSESSDGDGASLHLNNKSALVLFPRIKDGSVYTISFKAKNNADNATIGVRTDYFTANGTHTQGWWLDATGLTNEWKTYSFEIQSTGINEKGEPAGSESNFLVFVGRGNVLIDEVSVTQNSNTSFNYVPNNSFSADPNLDGYTLGNKASVVPQKDGSTVFLAGHKIRDGLDYGNRGYIKVPAANLPVENAPYTLSFEWRGGLGEAANVYYGESLESFDPQSLMKEGETATGWANDFWYPLVVEGLTPSRDILVCGGYWNVEDHPGEATYIRNISLKGSDGTEYILNKDLTFKEITYNDGGTETTQERVWGDTEVTAENPTEAGEVFVGWVDSLTEPTEIYRKGSTIQGVTEDKTLYALYVDYSMTEGASIWLGGGAEQSGIRWNTTISAEDKAVLDDLKAVYGTRVVSDDDKYADVTITKWCKPAGGRESFNTVLLNITRDGFDTVMEARSYIEITLTNDSEATRIYADVAEGATKRAIAQVAQAAIENGEFADDAEKLAILKEIAGTEVA